MWQKLSAWNHKQQQNNTKKKCYNFLCGGFLLASIYNCKYILFSLIGLGIPGKIATIQCINLLTFSIHYSFDVRDRTSNQPKHWSAPEVFGPRANFSIDNTPESLIIKVI